MICGSCVEHRAVISRQNQALIVMNDDITNDKWIQVDAVAQLSGKSDEELKAVLLKLHKNLGHPPNHDLLRVLKNAQASEQALRLARELSCDLCKSQQRPTVPLPAQRQKVSEVNQRVGIDVKYLQGWKPNQRVKALNIVDYASGFQRMVPFFETETASLIRTLLHEHWIHGSGLQKSWS